MEKEEKLQAMCQQLYQGIGAQGIGTVQAMCQQLYQGIGML